jgi:hypothetical protein
VPTRDDTQRQGIGAPGLDAAAAPDSKTQQGKQELATMLARRHAKKEI